jgi:transposase InsO family protein
MTRVWWVDSRKAEGYPVAAACAVAGISTSAYYQFIAQEGPSDRDFDDALLINAMVDIHRASDKTYGVPRMTRELADRGIDVNHKRVERLMRANGLAGVHRRRRVRTTIPAEDNPPVPDLVGRRFNPGAPDVAWASDITYIRTGEGWLFLASVLDLGSRRLIGYSMADHMRTELVASALDMAVAARGGIVDGVIAHADRGSQYMSNDYRCKIANLGMRQSVGRTGICWDNAVAEAFWATLKRELVDRYDFTTRAAARRAIFAWINYYNRARLHSSLDYQAPEVWETRYRRSTQQGGAQAA